MTAGAGRTPGLQDRVEAVLGPAYDNLRLLDVGGTSSIFLGVNRQIGRQEAIKVISWEHSDVTHGLERFRHEWRALGTLRHENIITIYRADVDERYRIAYLAEEYIEGGTLADRLGGHPLSVDEGIRVGIALADALAHAHHHDILHRDLKPGNVLTGDGSRVVLTDFGIAHRVGSKRLTLASDDLGSAGTPAYMSPEQLRHEELGPATDLYSLGLVLYEIFTGRRLFDGPDVATVAERHRRERPRSPDVLQPDLPPGLCSLIMGLLQKNPDRRPASARDVAVELRALRRAIGINMVREDSGRRADHRDGVTVGRDRDPLGSPPDDFGTNRDSPERARAAAKAADGTATGMKGRSPEDMRAGSIHAPYRRYRRWLVVVAAAIVLLLVGYGLGERLRPGSGPPDMGDNIGLDSTHGTTPPDGPAGTIGTADPSSSPGSSTGVSLGEPARAISPITKSITCPVTIRFESNSGSRNLLEQANVFEVYRNGAPLGQRGLRLFNISGSPGDSVCIQLKQSDLVFEPEEVVLVLPDRPETLFVAFRVWPGENGF